ncbi:hypothetical protein D3C76_1563770 [compost metagenome]
MHGLDNAFDPFMGTDARAPHHAIAGDQRTQRTANIAAVLGAVRCLNVGMHPETADDDTVLRLAQLGIIQFRFFIGAFQATLMVRLYTAFLTFGQFVLAHCASLESALSLMATKRTMIHAILY